METFDAIVIGLGAHGARPLSRSPGAGFASSGSRRESGTRARVVRWPLADDPPSLFRGSRLSASALGRVDRWESLSAAVGEPLVEVTGGLYAGPADSEVFRGSVASARDQGLPHEVLDAAEIRRRWPVFTVDDEVGGLYDPGAGMIRPDRAIEAQLRLAEEAGAELRFSSERSNGGRRRAEVGAAWRSRPMRALSGPSRS